MTRERGAIEGARAAVTGAGGFIGAAVCSRLAGEGADVLGIDVDAAATARVEAVGARFARADVTDPAACRAALADRELVVHTAASIADWGRMDDFVEVIARGTRSHHEIARLRYIKYQSKAMGPRVLTSCQSARAVEGWKGPGYEPLQEVGEQASPHHRGEEIAR